MELRRSRALQQPAVAAASLSFKESSCGPFSTVEPLTQCPVHPWDSVPVTIPFHDGEYLFEGGTDTHHTLSFEYTGYDCSDVATINVSVDVDRIG